VQGPDDERTTRTAVPDRSTFESAFKGQAPWGIGRPEKAFLDVAVLIVEILAALKRELVAGIRPNRLGILAIEEEASTGVSRCRHGSGGGVPLPILVCTVVTLCP
jgi:hypothetical protein